MMVNEEKLNTLAPIVLFVYNRLEHTKKTVESLLNNRLAKESTIYIFSDCYKTESGKENVLKVREYIRSISGFKEINIIERSENWGLAKSVINGATEIINKYNKIISVEDDLICAPNFLEYMNDGLNYYEKTPQIWAIGGHNHSFPMPKGYDKEYYLAIRTCSWGWATWKDRWDTVNWEVADFNRIKKDKHLQREFNRGGNDLFDMLKAQMNSEIDSWAIRWDYSASKQNRFTVYPIHTMIASTGMDGSGVHCTASSRYMDEIPDQSVDYKFDKGIVLNLEISKAVYDYYKKDSLHIAWTYISNVLDTFGLKKLKKKLKKIGKKIVENKTNGY